jgi:glycine/D-amino acid oxidase-like deaminating enzyme
MIPRDGANTSLWQNTSELFTPVRLLVPDLKYDVVIAGGGITGVSTALLLQQAGLRCLLLEAQTLCFGTTGGTTAHLNTLLDTPYNTIAKNFGKENASLVALATRGAIALVKDNILKYKIPCDFEETSAFLFSQNDDQTKELDSIREATVDAGLSAVYTDTIPVPIQFDRAIVVKNQGKFHPVRYVLALAKAFEEAGGTIVQHCRVHDKIGRASCRERVSDIV